MAWKRSYSDSKRMYKMCEIWDLANSPCSQIRELQMGTSQPLGFALQSTVTALSALGLALYTAWDLTLITVATIPFAAIILGWISSRMQPSIDAQAKELSTASKIANNTLQAIDVVKCFNGQDFETWQYAKAISRAAKKYLIQAKANASQIGFVRFITLSMFVQGFWYGSHIVISGKKEPGQVLTAFWSCLSALQAVEQILPQILVLEKGRAAGATLQAMFTQISKRHQAITTGHLVPEFCEGDIEVRNVSCSDPAPPLHCLIAKGIFPLPFQTRSTSFKACQPFLSSWRDDLRDWNKRFRKEHSRQSTHALL